MNFIFLRILMGFLIFVTSNYLWAFPELIRHGYKSCTSCHSSVVGGDLLTPYGKSLAQEVLSSHDFWKPAESPKDFSDNESQWNWGGHLRYLQIHKDNSQRRTGRFILMQLEADFSWTRGLWSTELGISREQPPEKAKSSMDFVSVSNAWIQYISSQESPSRFLFRLGKFNPGYGINIAEHTAVNRKLLNLGPGQERYNFETAIESEKYLLILDLVHGRTENRRIKKEEGLLLKFAWQGIDGFNFGLNTYQIQTHLNGRKVESKTWGGFATLSWSEHFSQLFQLDQGESTISQRNLALYSKLNFEIQKGINLFTTQEYFNEDLRIVNPHFEAIGVGIQYFPIAGIDLLAVLRQEKNTDLSNESDSVLWFLGHFYL